MFESLLPGEVTSVFATFGSHGECRLESVDLFSFKGKSIPGEYLAVLD